MSAVYDAVFKTRARSTHHKIALDALRHLRGPDAAKQRDLLLLHHDVYFEGAKAPDADFKDFTNHVLHVGENEWGGAIGAAQQWYVKTVEALAAKKWREAAYAAGVTSHYFADPHQPFHTGQTEEEGAIHRALEWSIFKSYEACQSILEDDLGGYPEVEPTAGDDWLAQLIRAGAAEAHASYHVLIDHYDLEAGRKDPPAGLDQEIKDRIAALIGLAVVGFARVLERAFADAATGIPSVSLAVKRVVVALDAPLQRQAAREDDRRTRRAVHKTWRELRKTGKVIRNLQPDDRRVRERHAEEVLGVSLRELDVRPLRKLGERHGHGAPARTSSPQPRTAVYDRPYVRQAAFAPEDVAMEPTLKRQTQAARLAASRARLTLDSDLEQAPSIGPKTATRFARIGVKTVGQLLAVNPKSAAAQLKVRHITPEVIEDWKAQAELVRRAPGLAGHDAQILTAVGVRDVAMLASMNARALQKLIRPFAASAEGARVLRSSEPPDLEEIKAWIACAKAALATAA
jgi:predicted flap endonuclease-1-like 5' DNA nuclease